MDVEIEWGFKAGMQDADYDGHIEGFFGLPGKAAPLPGDSVTAIEWPERLEIARGGGSRRGITMPVLYIQPADEFVRNMPKFPYGHPRDTRITVWTTSGSFTFLVRDLEKGPILAPEYGFFVAKAGSGKNAREFAAELAAANAKSIRADDPRTSRGDLGRRDAGNQAAAVAARDGAAAVQAGRPIRRCRSSCPRRAGRTPGGWAHRN